MLILRHTKRSGFSRGGQLIVENAGHEDLLPDSEARAAIVAFLKCGDPTVASIRVAALRFAPMTGDASGFAHPAQR